MRSFSRKDIDNSFPSLSVRRGEQYLRSGMVLDGALEDGAIAGAVRGSDGDPYLVRLYLKEGSRRISSHCSCPVGSQCKHGVALALYALEQGLLEAQVAAVPADPLPYEVADWLERIGNLSPEPAEIPEGSRYRVVYVLARSDRDPVYSTATVHIFNRPILKDGQLGAPKEYSLTGLDGRQFPKHFNVFDRSLALDLSHNSSRSSYTQARFTLEGRQGARLLPEILRSERCFYASPDGRPVRLGPLRSAKVVWVSEPNGSQRCTMEIAGGAQPFALIPPWYIDPASGECGPLECEIDPELACALLRAPLILPEHASSVRARLAEHGVPQDSMPKMSLPVEKISPKPTVRLDVRVIECNPHALFSYRRSRTTPMAIPFAKISFEYEGVVVAPSNHTEIRRALPDRIQVIHRDARAETTAERRVQREGWHLSQYLVGYEVPHGYGTSFCIYPADEASHLAQLQRFIDEAVPVLEQEGWRIEVPSEFCFIPESRVEWDLGIESLEGVDWFEFRLGIRVDGQAIDLRPILLQILREENASRSAPAGHRSKRDPNDDDYRYVTLPNGSILQLSKKRVESLVQPLVELFGEMEEWPDDLKLPKSRVLDADEVAEVIGLPWKTTDELEALSRQLEAFSSLMPLPEPKGFHAVLRDYQRQGLAWLQFLREYGFSGILADDMGLGKTIQVLAHLQMEKLAGRLDKPCLVVAPTSTLPNWRREAERFLPDLKILVLHGPGRKDLFAEMDSHELVLTNYALLPRDRSELLKQNYHMVVLDEAQNVKNHSTAGAKVARELTARHRLCLSGTPVENHLDELWSLFHFLMPGFLGGQTSFRKRFRTPIEQKADPIAREQLSRRIRPFMLRRTKQQVVKELPEKTEIVETVELEDSQRDLYESMRLMMDERVRTILSAKSLGKSRIQVLDALLKLRQVCCDPRLVKLPSARSVTDSAKLERLMEMLSVLLEDGRKILLFSQFTSMLDLIEARLREVGVEWVRISGDTADRDTPVQRFQSGDVPLFLISLKAGGTGLNLVAADTVIHYDPWWNPAVERQATDRAYRIGQDKAVMVYKLVTSGTVEEKILDLQKRKGALAESVLSDSEDPAAALSQVDLAWLFERS